MKFLHTGNFLWYNFDAFLRPRIFWLEIRTNSKGGVGALKLRNCHRGNVAEPDLWDLWAALESGGLRLHISSLYNGCQRNGGEMSNKKPKRVFGINSQLEKGVKAKGKHFLGK